MWPMIIMICVGCLLAIAGLVMVAVAGLRLIKALRAAGIDSVEQARDVARRVRELRPRIEETSRSAQVAAERLESLAAATEKLNYLYEEIDEKVGPVFRLKS